jgi:hypothetical protein
MQKLLDTPVCFGAKSTRGYGSVTTAWASKQFDLTSTESLNDWLNFDMFNEQGYPEAVVGQAGRRADTLYIEIGLRQKGGLSIRHYATDVNEPTDYRQLSLKNGTYVIPGTSWAGLFRRSMAQWLKCKDDEGILAKAMGYVYESKDSRFVRGESNAAKSKIKFKESTLKNCQPKTLTRNAIDRYSGGAKDKALYTEKTVYYGTTTLTIEVAKSIDEAVKAAFLASIFDLHNGFIALGGLTSVGRGLFAITSLYLNGVPIEDVDFSNDLDNDSYQKVWEVLVDDTDSM